MPWLRQSWCRGVGRAHKAENWKKEKKEKRKAKRKKKKGKKEKGKREKGKGRGRGKRETPVSAVQCRLLFGVCHFDRFWDLLELYLSSSFFAITHITS